MPDFGPLNPQQRLAVETLKGPVLILAGAGTGKTRVITCRIAHLIERGVPPGHMLAVTFTNKAAREMLERVHRMLPAGGRATVSNRAAGSEGRAAVSDRAARESDDGVPGRRGPTRAVAGEPVQQDQGSSPDPILNPTDGSAPPQASPAPRPTICTFHSLGVRILRQHIERLGYKRNFVIYSESDQLGAVKKILSHISVKGEQTDPQAVLALLSRFKNEGVSAAAFADPSVAAMAEHIRSRYDNALRACNAVDFDDLLLLTLKLLEDHPDILASCRDRFRYVMVDEYQDTNAAQFHLVHLLTREHRNLCVVGDDDQSIYGWRGARIANLLDMEKHFPEVKVIKLEQNYRSTNTILHAANAVIKNNSRRRGKQLWSSKGQGAKIALHTFASDDDEARGIVEMIEYARLARGSPWADHAILFRTNQQSRPLETALRQAGVRYHLIGGQSYFDRREVKDFLAYLKVFVNPHDDVSLLRIANVPARGLSDATMQRLLAASHEHHGSVYSAMTRPELQADLAARTRESLQEFVCLVERTRGQLLGDQPVSLRSWAEGFLAATGYLEDLRRSEKTPAAGENRVRNVQALVAELEALDADVGQDEQASGAPLPTQVQVGRAVPCAACRNEFPKDGAQGTARATNSGISGSTSEASREMLSRLQTFLDELMLETDRETEDEASGDAVTLITMHSCKGLEFPQVYIVGLEEGLLPHSRSKAEGTLEEERRLFYVAITRARETLTLSHCQSRKKFGQPTPCHPSSFLRELPPDLVEAADDKSRRPVAADSGKQHFAALRAAVG